LNKLTIVVPKQGENIMDKLQVKRSNGQILVIVTLMLVGLMAMLAFVLDGGNLYSQRRQAQLAADAGALAGARAHCDPDVDEDPVVAANEYVTINNATLKNFTMGPGENEVTVETSITFDTFFLHILGRPELTAEAIAAAECQTGGAARVLPVAWSCKPPDIFTDTIPITTTCELDLEPDDTECCYPDSPEGDCDDKTWDKFYIVIDSDDLGDSMFCAEDINVINWETFNCSFCDTLVETDDNYDNKFDYCHSEYPKCDVNCDGEKDVEILKESSFGWMDLDGGGSDANELSEWVTGEGVPEIYIHYWYGAKSGIAGSVFKTVGDEIVGEQVVVPVFDHFCHGVPSETNDECEWHEGPPVDDALDDIVPSGGTFEDYFHIIGFANYKITCVEAGSYKDCAFHDFLDLAPSVKTIEGCFVAGVDPDITGYGGADFDAYTLVLSR
jgi:hypothetical protein